MGVFATSDIKKNTLIGEYTGIVKIKSNCLTEISNNYLFDLTNTSFVNESLVVDAKKYGNITKFINGVNVYDSNSFKNINCNTIHANINDQIHILIYTSKDVKKDDELLFDYTGGSFNSNIDTSEFI